MIVGTLALRSIRRNPFRSLMIATMSTSGTALLIIGISWIFGLQHSVIDTMTTVQGEVRITTTAFERNEMQLPVSHGIENTDATIDFLRSTLGLPFAYTRLSQYVVWFPETNEQQENLSVFTALSSEYYTDQLHMEKRLLNGRMIQASGELIVGISLAQANSLQINQTLILFGQTQDGSFSPLRLTIVGISDFGNPVQNQSLFGRLSDARQMADIPHGGSEILIYSPERSRDIAEKLNEHYSTLLRHTQTTDRNGEAIPLSIRAWDQREPFRSLLPALLIFDLLLILSILLVTALGIANTNLLSVLERRKEIGLLRAIGISPHFIVRTIIVESVLVIGAGSLLGCFFGSGLSISMQSDGVPLGEALSSTSQLIAQDIVYPEWRIEITIMALLLSLFSGGLAALLPLLYLLRQNITSLLKERH